MPRVFADEGHTGTLSSFIGDFAKEILSSSGKSKIGRVNELQLQAPGRGAFTFSYHPNPFTKLITMEAKINKS